MEYKVKLDSFEGPLDLLLNLIEKAKIDIYDIPINLITEQYMNYIYQMEYLNMKIASEFILMAATLLQIKSRMLLPNDSKDTTEEEIVDPREELVLQLKTYKKYKIVAENFKRYEKPGLKSYYKPREDLSTLNSEEVNLKSMDLKHLLRSINKIISSQSLSKKIDIHQIQKNRYSVNECSDNIINLLNIRHSITFTELLSAETNISEIVTYFLSILELTKLQLVLVQQNENHTNLTITSREVGEP
ncbi:MAG TPA: segregation/condensation protein A [Tissierellaceae bacterium]|nr:segregation/condensation protein A [Tissierellaceae bacterium]